MVAVFYRAAFLAGIINSLSIISAEDMQPEKWLETKAITVDAAVEPKSELNWYDATSLSLEDKAFEDTLTSFSRLSNRHKEMVTEGVWRTGTNSAGVTLRFITDSPEIWAVWNNSEPMVHMAYTGSGGLDIYKREHDKWVFFGMARPTTSSKSLAQFRPANAVPDVTSATEYLVFLPLYSKVDFIRIGVTPGSKISPAPERYADKLPIVFYGTSITQGGCASRSGMAHPAIIRRWLDRPVYNLGFSGAGKCESAMANILADIPAAIYVVETVSNMTPAMVEERVVPFMEKLRTRRPDTPILMVESPNVDRESGTNQTYHKTFEKLKAAGMANIHYLEGERLYRGRENPTVDGSHPTDLGFYEMALAYEVVLKNLLNTNKD